MQGKLDLRRSNRDLTLELIPSGHHEGQARMKTSNRLVVPTLCSDLVPFISERNTSTFLVRLDAVGATRGLEDDRTEEVVIASFRLIEILHAAFPFNSDGSIRVPVKRNIDPAVRNRMGLNHWNNLGLQSGDLLILAVQATDVPGLMVGRAAATVDSLESDFVAATRQCYYVEFFGGSPSDKLALFSEALASRESILRSYALDGLGRRLLFGRELGADIIARAIASGNGPLESKFELGFYLARLDFFDSDQGADKANQSVIFGLTVGLVTEANAERRLEWMNYLASCVLSEFASNDLADQAARFSLLRSVRTPQPSQVLYALSCAAGGKADEVERERIDELSAVWRAVDEFH